MFIEMPPIIIVMLLILLLFCCVCMVCFIIDTSISIIYMIEHKKANYMVGENKEAENNPGGGRIKKLI